MKASSGAFICSYGTLELKAVRTYQSYLWSNNATIPAIIISKPGTYYLQVLDDNACQGKDTINVKLKDCMQGFYAPNAFTPNNDKTNETFRPLLFGNVKQYRFMIFNKWGSKVFESNTPGDGWNGLINGIPQDSNTFVWTCSYQLEGEPVQVRKGTMVLIR
jgi:gliding motility-associated-like protein